jgi:hypothetical protein
MDLCDMGVWGWTEGPQESLSSVWSGRSEEDATTRAAFLRLPDALVYQTC